MSNIEFSLDGKTIKARVFQKTDTLANWLANTNIIGPGEQAFVIGESGQPINFKIGDGTKTFSELPYWIRYDQAAYIQYTATPTEEVAYTIVGPGTYGSITVANDEMAILSWDGSSWSGQLIELPTVEGTDTLEDEEIPKGIAVKDYVNPISNRLNAITEEEDVILTIKNDTYTSVSYNVTHAFSGFGFTFGVEKGFNRITLKLAQRDSSPQLFSKLLLRICEDDYQGSVLFKKEYNDLNITSTTIQDLVLDIDLIENTNNKPLWFEFVVDGYVGLYKGSMTARSWRYKTGATSGSTLTDFKVSSSEGGAGGTPSTNVPFYIKLENVTKHVELILPPFSDEISLLEDNAPKSSAVAQKFLEFNESIDIKFNKYDKVIVDAHKIISEVVLGNNTKGTSNSTFAGWGQLFGNISGFNCVQYTLNAYDEDNKPTYIEFIMRKNSWDGDILYRIKTNVSPILNEPEPISFYLGEIFENESDDDIFISYLADGYFSQYRESGVIPNGERIRYRTTKGQTTTNALITTDSTLYTSLQVIDIEEQISENETQRIVNVAKEEIEIFDNPDFILTTKVWLYPTFQYNIFNKNVYVPKFGDNLNNYRIDYTSTYGQHFNRGYRYNNISPSVNSTVTASLMKGRNVLSSKTQNILSTSINNGSGITRNVLIVGDSTVNGSNISTPLKAVFDSDLMNINLIGTLGNSGVKHEGRGGWTINDYYGIGRILYKIDVSGVTTSPSINAVYSQGSNTYTVLEVNITAGTGYFSVQITSGLAPTSSGTLTKVSGSGDTSISYSSMTDTSANPFYNPSTSHFDLEYYLTTTSQVLNSNDWIFFQLGINDVFGQTNVDSAKIKVSEMIVQMNYIINNIKNYNSSIRVGIVVTFPPANQDAFGFSYSNGQTSEMYIKTGLITWQKKLISEFDNDVARSNNIYLVSAHLNLDTEYNYPTNEVAVNSRNPQLITMQSNGVHPNTYGYAQIADMYAGLIKYFG